MITLTRRAPRSIATSDQAGIGRQSPGRRAAQRGAQTLLAALAVGGLLGGGLGARTAEAHHYKSDYRCDMYGNPGWRCYAEHYGTQDADGTYNGYWYDYDYQQGLWFWLGRTRSYERECAVLFFDAQGNLIPWNCMDARRYPGWVGSNAPVLSEVAMESAEVLSELAPPDQPPAAPAQQSSPSAPPPAASDQPPVSPDRPPAKRTCGKGGKGGRAAQAGKAGKCKGGKGGKSVAAKAVAGRVAGRLAEPVAAPRDKAGSPRASAKDGKGKAGAPREEQHGGRRGGAKKR